MAEVVGQGRGAPAMKDPKRPSSIGEGLRGEQLAVRFGWVSLLQDLGSKMVVPLVPLFLTVSLGASTLVVGLVDGVATATVAVTAPIAGRLTARVAPLRLTRVGYGLSSVAKLLLAATSAWGTVLAVRVVDRLGKGVRDAPRDLLLAAGGARRRGRRFGIQRAMDKFGGFLGPLLGVVVFEATDGSFRWVFVVAFLPCALSVALLWGRFPDAGAEPSDGRPDGAVAAAQRRALGLVGLHDLAAVPLALVIVRGIEVGLGVSDVLLAFSLYRLATALVAYPAGALVDRLGPTAMVAAGMVTTALAFAVALSTTSAAVWAALGLLGIADGARRSAQKVWLAELGTPAQRGPAFGLLSSVGAATALVGGIGHGAAFTGYATWSLGVAAVGCTIAAAGVVLSSRMARP